MILLRQQQGLMGANASTIYLPPTSYPGLTAWLDATDASTLFKNANATSAVSVDGDRVWSIANKAGGGRPYWTVLSQGTTDPSYQVAEVNGKSVVAMSAISNYFEPYNNDPLSNYIANSAFTMTLVAKYTGTPMNNAGAVYDGALVFGDRRSTGYMGLYIHNSTNELRGYNYDGSTDTVPSAGLDWPTNTYTVIQFRHGSGNLQIRRDSGSLNTVASGNTSNIAGLIRVGYQGSSATAGLTFLHAVCHNVALSDADMDAERDWALHELGML